MKSGIDKTEVERMLDDYTNSQIKLGNVICAYLRESLENKPEEGVRIDCLMPIDVDWYREAKTVFLDRGDVIVEDWLDEQWDVGCLNINALIAVYHAFNQSESR